MAFDLQYIGSMRPVFNLKALFSDTTEQFVTPAEPAGYDLVTIRFRTARNNVDNVWLVTKGKKISMTKFYSEDDFDYYSCEYQLENEILRYHFEVRTGTLVAYYDVRGLCHEPNDYYDIPIIPGFQTPDWAKGAVFYQIFVGLVSIPVCHGRSRVLWRRFAGRHRQDGLPEGFRG